MHTPETYEWTITAIVPEVEGVKTLVLEAQGERPTFVHGQYLTVRLPGFEPREGKSYSISSTPTSKEVSLTIRAIGNFSHALLAHKVDDTLITSAPYGFFYPEADDVCDLVFVAGGIGITPCMSIIESLLNDPTNTRAVRLFYGNRRYEDIIFKDRLDTLTTKHPNFTCHHFITREAYTDPTHTPRRMTGMDIVSHLQNPPEHDFFICGSIGFTKDLWSSLKAAGVPSSRIYTEGFF